MISLNESKRKLQFAVVGAIIIAILALVIPILFFRSSNKVETPTLSVEKVIPPNEQTEKLPQDIKAKKQKIIDGKLKEDKGDYIIYDSAEYKIVYLPSREIFFATIKVEPVAKNRENVQNWFEKFDLKQEDLCNLPLRLLVDSKFKKANLDFSPLPDGCT
ncbi:MAG: hypothetical protein AAB512_05185 [Patescibacteria group bacterium]